VTKTEDNPTHLKTGEPSRLRQAPRCLVQRFLDSNHNDRINKVRLFAVKSLFCAYPANDRLYGTMY
jgi:hypothetical protein